MKKKYSKSQIKIFEIKIEESITSSSAITKPQNSSDVQTEWETDDDVTQSFSWE